MVPANTAPTSNTGEDLLVYYKDSEKLVSQDSPPGVWNRILYSNSSKCSRTKASIVISKGMFLIVGVAVPKTLHHENQQLSIWV